MAESVKKIREKYLTKVIIRFIGATHNSFDIKLLLENLYGQIYKYYGIKSEIAQKNKLLEEFPNLLGLATEDKPLILFLDSI